MELYSKTVVVLVNLISKFDMACLPLYFVILAAVALGVARFWNIGEEFARVCELAKLEEAEESARRQRRWKAVREAQSQTDTTTE